MNTYTYRCVYIYIYIYISFSLYLSLYVYIHKGVQGRGRGRDDGRDLQGRRDILHGYRREPNYYYYYYCYYYCYYGAGHKWEWQIYIISRCGCNICCKPSVH